VRVILLETMEKLGKAGSVVKVADGYARNYLLPRNMAIMANKNNLKKLETIKSEAEQKELEATNALKALAQQVDGTQLIFKRKADENDHLYGSVSDIDIAHELNEKGFEVHKSMVIGEKHIKAIGTYDIEIQFASEITANIKVMVEKEEQ